MAAQPEDNMNRAQSFVLALLLSVACNAIAGEKGYLGVSFSVDGEGFFLNPTLTTVKIEKVVPNSPAAKAGIEPGDLLLEVGGKKIAGAKANDLRQFMDLEAGQTVHLAIQKSSREVKQLAVVAGPKIE
jgi:C-terminal processing protease CtpA/Prc